MLDCLNFRTLVTTNAPINVNRMGGGDAARYKGWGFDSSAYPLHREFEHQCYPAGGTFG